MHLIDESVGFKGSTAIVGGTIPIGVGLALSIDVNGTDQVSTVFLGDGAVEEGVFYESVNFAALRKLPVLFICENNFYSVYSPLRVRQPEGRRIHEMVAALGVRSSFRDGNDALGVYQACRDAVAAIRRGEGPQFIEFETYRWREHCGPFYDNDIGYRTEAEFAAWKVKDPVARLEARLRVDGLLDDAAVAEMTSRIDAEVAEAFAFAENAPFPSPGEAYDNLYSDPS